MTAVVVSEKGPGRPLFPVDLARLAAFAQRGCTMKEAAALLGMGYSTFRNRYRDDEEFAQVWDKNIACAALDVRNLMWRHARGRGPAAVTATVHMAKHLLGETDKSVVEHANKDGKPFQVATAHPTHFLGIELASATDEELAALQVIAEGQERRAAEAARDVSDEVVEDG